MKPEIKKILADLYQLDSGLQKNETELVKIIENLLIMKPDTKFDRKFAQQLRSRLLSSVESDQQKNYFKNLASNFMDLKRFGYIFGGVVLVAVLIVPTVYYANREGEPSLDVQTGITHLAANAFGSLAEDNQTNRDQAVGLGGGGATAQMLTKVTSSVAPESSIAVGMPAPGYYVNYQYVYKGDPITIDQQTMPVYKRVKGSQAGAALAGLAKNAGLNLLDLGTFNNLSVDNISFSQNVTKGYMMNVSFSDSVISISQDWRQWQSAVPQEYQPLTIDQMLSDDQLIGLANDFIKKHNINLDSYGNPVVNKQWRLYYGSDNQQYVPDNIAIVYPLQIDGHEIYDQSGNPAGVSVNIDLRNKVVSGAYNMIVPDYQSSDYQVETDTDKILKIAQGGGNGSVMPFYDNGGNSKTVEISLGMPTLVYVQIWKFNPENQTSDDLYAPAFIFPIIKNENSQNFYQQNIVVPIIKDLLQDNNSGPIRIMEQGMGSPVSVGTAEGGINVSTPVQPSVDLAPDQR
ncbi:MAG: hypothetical protein JW816_00450 [Candidatus Buchananbacteria bacterium]|nr:hypothetical protein [Candidatus Buchananbacteria bacterium]